MYNTLAALCISNVGDDALGLLGKQRSMTGKLMEVMHAVMLQSGQSFVARCSPDKK